MYSAEGDVVLDPFLGLGTTSIACMLSHRNSIGIEIDPEIADIALTNMNIPVNSANRYINNRIKKHLDFIETLPAEKRERCYTNNPHGFAVKTKQETAIEIEQINQIIKEGRSYICKYEKLKYEPDPVQIVLPGMV